MVHARLFPGEENSGKLVSLLKMKAREMAEKEGKDLVIADGPPGIGCPVISSLSGASLAVIVTEPTPSGLHDLKRVIELCDHFQVPVQTIINKSDLNAGHTRTIERFCRERNLEILGELPHDSDVTMSMVAGQTVTEFKRNGFSEKIERIWRNIESKAVVENTA
jgi:MinD superfamily P-loop ATPase